MQVRYSYLEQQFANCDDLWVALKEFVATGDFTLGKALTEFEDNFSKLSKISKDSAHVCKIKPSIARGYRLKKVT